MKILARTNLTLLLVCLAFSLSQAQSSFQSARPAPDVGFPNIREGRGGLQERRTAPSEIVPQEEAIDPATYYLGPHDEVTVGIWDEVSQSIPLRITPEGKIILSPAGLIELKGLTVREAEEEVCRVLKSFYPDIEITLSLTGIRPIKVHISGEVLYPGSYDATPVDRVFDLIQMAGGLLPGGSVRNLSIKHPAAEEVENVDMERFLYHGDLGGNPHLSEGVLVHIPQKRNTIQIRGAINGTDQKADDSDESPTNEMVLDFKEGDRLSDALLRTGGVKEAADLRNARIIRHDSEAADSIIPVDLYGFLVLGDDSFDLPLIKGDIIEIPGGERNVYVTGMVAEPGAYAYQPNLTVREYVGMAGGPSDIGSHGGWKVVDDSGKRRRIKQTYVVKPGETIVIPERFMTKIGKFLLPLSAASTIIISIVALQK